MLSLFLTIGWALALLMGRGRHVGKLGMCPADLEQDDTLPSCTSSRAEHRCPFRGLLVPCFPEFCGLGLVVSWFEVATKRSAQALSGAPKFKCTKREQAGMRLTDRMCVLDKLHSGTRSRADGREFRVNKLTIFAN